VNTVLCVCTYRRPDGLRSLLDSLTELEGAEGIHVVVVDNHADGEGAAVCENLPDDYPYTVHSSVEPQAGISPARNAAVTKALSMNPRFLAFLDDDEHPSTQWLSELLRVQAETDADAVGGPTLSVFPEDTDESIRNNPYFGADLSIQDGASCQLQAAGNFLITADCIKTLAPTFFRPEFAQSGGEDPAFFTQLQQGGASMHWAAQAIVHEAVPANRLTDSWMKSRVIGIANSRVRVMQMLQPGLPAALIRGLKTVALGIVAGLQSIIGLISPDWRHRARLLRWKFWGKFTAHLRIATTRGEGH